MAKRKAPKKVGPTRTRSKLPAKKKAPAKKAARKATGKRPTEQTFKEFGDLKDRVAMAHAKSFADHMFDHEEALEAADDEKAAVFKRLKTLGVEHFTAHGYEFGVKHGEDTFTVRKVKRGSKPASETPVDSVDGGEARPEPEFDTDAGDDPDGDLGDDPDGDLGNE